MVKVGNKALFGQAVHWKQLKGAERVKHLLTQFSHNNFYGSLEVEEIVAILSVKLTTRPDRRYQYLHEANTIRAMFLNLTKVPPYIIATTQIEKAEDKKVFASPTLLSAAVPALEQQPSVNVFELETLQDLSGLLNFISTVS